MSSTKITPAGSLQTGSNTQTDTATHTRMAGDGMCPQTPDSSQVSHEETEAMAPNPQSVQGEPYLPTLPPEVFPKYTFLP